MDYLEKLIGDIEEHSVEGIRECFTNGISPNDQFNNAPLIDELTSEYLRSPRFKNCVQVFVDHGMIFPDKPLLAVLLDAAETLEQDLKQQPELINKRYSLRCAFTPLHDVTLLHICAEFNHVACAKTLVEYGANVNAKAGHDEYGFGGQTPIFHTVNQIHNQSADMLHFLLEKSADLHYTIPGLVWGKGYDWETFIASVNPLSYAMMGLLPQMHRKETVITQTVSVLLKKAYGIDYSPSNVPNKYLRH